MNKTKSRIFHVTFPGEWATAIERECERKQYTVSEYFKDLYRRYKEEETLKRDLFMYESDKESGAIREIHSLSEKI